MWIVLSLACAFFLATSDMLCKKALKNSDAGFVAWARMAFAAPFLTGLAFAGSPPEHVGAFVLLVAALVPLEVLALFMYMAALKKSPLSLTVPFLAFTPGFLTVTGWFFLGERVNGPGLAGVALVAAGAYVLTSGGGARGALAPLKNFFRAPGCPLMMGVAAIYSVTAAAGKKLILWSSPMFVACHYFLAVLLGLTLAVALRPGGWGGMKRVFSQRIMWGAGLTQAGMIITHALAISMAPAAYMIAVKRTSLFFGVLYGVWVFHEPGAKFRAPGSLLMLAGVFTLGFCSQ